MSADVVGALKTLRVFVSSPGDVEAERVKAREVFDRLQTEFSGVLQISPYFWEHEPMFAHTGFQPQIEPPSQFDLFVCLLWARLGTRLPSNYRKPDGSPYASGTEWELLDALEGFRRSRAPEVLIYRRTVDPVIPMEPEGEGERVLKQYRALQEFVARLTTKDGTYVVATNSYRGLDQFETKFENDMRRVLEGRVPEGVAGSRALPKTWKDGSPFRGLRHFDFEHAPVFFGRTREIDEVLAALERQAAEGRPFVLVFGSSGVGKSSLVRAGVLPWLVRPGVVDGVGLWRRAIIRPGQFNDGDLFDALAMTLLQADALPELSCDGTTAADLARMLREAPDGVGMLIKGALSQAAREAQVAQGLERQPRALCALVVDQLEELFTIESLAKQREPFLRAVDALARSRFVWVVATLRSDFYSRCEESLLLMELKNGAGQYHLGPPDGVQLGQMIRLPAAAAGLRFQEDHKTGRRLDDVLRDAARVNPSSLPLLEFALEELYLRADMKRGLLRLDDYNAMGGVEGALGKRAEESFVQTSASIQASFAQVFRKLVTINIARDEPAVRRRARQDELAVDQASRGLIDQLVKDRLLVADRTDDDVVVVSVAHEAMLNAWPRLKDWIASHRESLKSHAEVTADTQRWIESGRHVDYLYRKGRPLSRAEELLEAGFLSRDEQAFVRGSLRQVAAEQFEGVLDSGEGMPVVSAHLQARYPELRQQILRAVIAGDSEMRRAHAATLLGQDPIDEITPALVSLVAADRSDQVRRAAAASLVQLDHSAYFDEVARLNQEEGRRSDALRAMAHVRVAADAAPRATSFETRFGALGPALRMAITMRAWGQRLWRGLPTLLIVLLPALVLSSVTAGPFKALPGLLNYQLAHARAGAAPAMFQGVLASFVWGGTITLCIALHSVVFAVEREPKSLTRPRGAIVAGAIGGVISSFLIMMVCLIVSDSASAKDAGWTTVTREDSSGLYWPQLLYLRAFFWPYMVMGTGLGVGMALMTNLLRPSPEWQRFLHGQSYLTGGAATWLVVRSLTRLLWRFAWPIAVSLLVADVLAFEVLRHAPQHVDVAFDSWGSRLLGGIRDKELSSWRISAWGEALCIGFDSVTQAIGGFFCIVGLGLGLVAIRYGVKIEARKG